MLCAGVLLTGGGSRRMGRDKAALPVPGDRPELTLGGRTAALLAAVCRNTVEVGPGYTRLTRVVEPEPRAGPLAGMVAGWLALRQGGWEGPLLVVATDLPNLTEAMLRWLGDHPGAGSVVPVAGGRVQPLCARYSPADLDTAAGLVATGRRAMKDLMAATDPYLASDAEWAPAAGGPSVLDDVDTPADLRRAWRP